MVRDARESKSLQQTNIDIEIPPFLDHFLVKHMEFHSFTGRYASHYFELPAGFSWSNTRKVLAPRYAKVVKYLIWTSPITGGGHLE